MDNNPYGYDKRMPRQMPQNQPYTNNYPGVYINQQPGAPQAPRSPQTPGRKAQTSSPPARMPKARALALTRLFKKSLVVMSLATFAAFSGLVAYHQVGTASTATSTPATSTATSSQQKNNTFFNQQGDDNLGTSTPTATPTSGSASGSNSNSSSGPSSGSNVS